MLKREGSVKPLFTIFLLKCGVPQTAFLLSLHIWEFHSTTVILVQTLRVPLRIILIGGHATRLLLRSCT